MTVKAGDKAPAFTLIDDEGTKVSLSGFKGRNVVIYFYPKAFTPGCTIQACDIRDRYETFLDAGHVVLGISPDSPERLASFRDKFDLPFPLLSDPDHKVAEAYGAWGKKQNYGRTYQGIIRSTFVIDPKGVIAEAWHNVKAAGHADRLLKEISD